jgi:hypothetical protein
MNYVIDYCLKTSNYKYQNMNKNKMVELIKKNIGMTFYNDMQAYFIKKGLTVDF